MSDSEHAGGVTRLLAQVAGGNEGAVEQLVALVYDQLRAVARKGLRRERPEHTLSATALVHEAWLRLAGDGHRLNFKNRKHFYHAAAEAMRRVLIDHARRGKRVKRGGGRKRVLLNVVDLAREQNPEEILAVDEAICRLEKEDARAGQIVRLRFFAGLSVEETAEALGVSPRTVMGDWRSEEAHV